MVTTRAKRSIKENPPSKQPKRKSVKKADTTEAVKAAENDVEVKYQPKPDEKDTGWSTGSPEMEEDNQHISFLLATWISTNAADGPEDAQLSRSQKHAIIKSLEGSSCRKIGMCSEDKAVDENFGQRLDYLYERFLETNPVRAAASKRETVRLSNSVHKMQAPNNKLGHYHKERRDGLAGQFVDDTLSSELIRWLLKPLDSEEAKDRRRKELIRIYGVIMELSISHNAAQGCLEFGRPDVLGQTFHVFSKTMRPHKYHFLRNHGVTPDHRLDGHRVLLVVYPAMTRTRLRPDPLSESIGARAYVVVEDPQEEQEVQPAQEPQEV